VSRLCHITKRLHMSGSELMEDFRTSQFTVRLSRLVRTLLECECMFSIFVSLLTGTVTPSCVNCVSPRVSVPAEPTLTGSEPFFGTSSRNISTWTCTKASAGVRSRCVTSRELQRPIPEIIGMSRNHVILFLILYRWRPPQAD
jgi:hypothetical protein